MRCAAIDIGTVTCRLLVADSKQDGLVELDRRCAITNLGIGVDTTGVLVADAIDRVVDQVASYVKIIDSYRDAYHQTIPLAAIATSASRDARNSSELVERLQALGVALSVIEGAQEAALSFKGASGNYTGENILVVDIGGGSTEVIFGVGGSNPQFVHSFNIGCRRVTERYFHTDPPTAEELNKAREWVRSQLVPVFHQARSQGCIIDRVVAVAGTATSVVSIDKRMVIYDSAQVDGTRVPQATLQRIYDDLAQQPLCERKQVIGLEPARASVIVAGLAVLLEVLDVACATEFTVSESDILQGLIMDMSQRVVSHVPEMR